MSSLLVRTAAATTVSVFMWHLKRLNDHWITRIIKLSLQWWSILQIWLHNNVQAGASTSARTSLTRALSAPYLMASTHRELPYYSLCTTRQKKSDIIIHLKEFLAESWVRRSIPLSHLYGKYKTSACSWLAKLRKPETGKQLALLCLNIIRSASPLRSHCADTVEVGVSLSKSTLNQTVLLSKGGNFEIGCTSGYSQVTSPQLLSISYQTQNTKIVYI